MHIGLVYEVVLRFNPQLNTYHILANRHGMIQVIHHPFKIQKVVFVQFLKHELWWLAASWLYFSEIQFAYSNIFLAPRKLAPKRVYIQ